MTPGDRKCHTASNTTAVCGVSFDERSCGHLNVSSSAPFLLFSCHVSSFSQEMSKAGCKLPLLIGGATTSKMHTAVKISPQYASPEVSPLVCSFVRVGLNIRITSTLASSLMSSRDCSQSAHTPTCILFLVLVVSFSRLSYPTSAYPDAGDPRAGRVEVGDGCGCSAQRPQGGLRRGEWGSGCPRRRPSASGAVGDACCVIDLAPLLCCFSRTPERAQKSDDVCCAFGWAPLLCFRERAQSRGNSNSHECVVSADGPGRRQALLQLFDRFARLAAFFVLPTAVFGRCRSCVGVLVAGSGCVR